MRRIVANILLIESMQRGNLNTAATIYRLNLAPAAICAVIFLHEKLTISKTIAVACAVLAVMLFYQRKNGADSKSNLRYGFILMVTACLLRAMMGLAYKAGLNTGADKYHILMINGIFWLVGGLAYYIFREWHMRFDRSIVRYGIISGIMVCGIVFFLAYALQVGDASLVLPVSQLSFILTAVLALCLLNEKLDRRKLMGLFCGVLCVILMSQSVFS